MDWRYYSGALCTLIWLFCSVVCETVKVHVEVGDRLDRSPRLIFNSSLGVGWSYFLDRNSRNNWAHSIFSLDSSTGCLYLKEPSRICSLLQCNPVEIKIQGRTHFHSINSPANYSVTCLHVHFQNVSCSVPKHRKTVFSSSSEYSVHVVTFSNLLSKSKSFYCHEKYAPLVNLRHYVPLSLQSGVCRVMIENSGYYFNTSSSFITSKTGQCLIGNRLKIPLKLACKGNQQSLSVLLEINMANNNKNDFYIAGDSDMSSHARMKRQTKPQFTEQSYTATVAENQSIGRTVIHLTANDPDPGNAGKLTYSMTALLNTLSNSMFSIDPVSGMVTTTQSLDREQIPTHLFLVTVTDSGTLRQSATTTLTINVEDENDHTPTFDKSVYEVSPEENTAVKSVIVTVQATDGDSGQNAEIRYSIVNPSNSDTFKIDPVAGVVSTLRTLDRESQAQYQLIVQAVDQAAFGERRSSTATIKIAVQDENDNAPQFLQSSYSINITENIDVTNRPVVASISATDADEGRNQDIRYSITNGNTNNIFNIDPVTGEVRVYKELDYESTQSFQLRIKAADNGVIAKQNTTTLWIRILDQNDNPPYFQTQLYKGAILEGASIGSSVLTVHALDSDSGKNAELTYSLVDLNSSFPFAINADSGQISVRANVDREVSDSYLFMVKVADNGERQLSATTTVQIHVNDVNDNSPIFAKEVVYVTISEDAAIFSQVVQVTANDADSAAYATLRYEITSGNTRQMFSIDRSTGVITLQSKLDYKIQNKYILEVRAYDNDDKYGSCEVRINVTDTNKVAPSFEKPEYKFTISEGQNTGASVGKVFASDTDFGENGRVSYEIVDNIPEFAIDPNSGEITTREKLNRELTPGYSFDVRASDNGNPSKKDTASVVVVVSDTNDNVPEFIFNGGESVYTANISEAAFDNTLVLTVTARDADDGLNAKVLYKFADHMNGNGDFEIDEASGAIRVAKNNHIDRETQNNYTLIVLAVDGGHIPQTGTASVRIRIDDINDNAPQFPSDTIIAPVPENLPIGSTVAVVQAVDPDEGVNAIIEYSFEGGADADKFVLYNQPGKPASIINHIDLDYESDKKEYIIRLKAASKTLISAANIIIKVEDVNDNAPVLKDFTIIFNNYIDHFPVGPIGRIPAFDPDVSDQSKLTYELLTGNEMKYLILNETSGEITLDSRLNSDVPRNGTMLVRVSGKFVK